MRKLKIAIFAFVLILGLSYYSYRHNTYTPVDEFDDSSISFQIKKGQSVKEIAANLEEKELINNETFFYLYTKFNNLGENIIAGRFLLNKTLNTPQILKLISDPTQAEFIITIQEGLTVKDIDQKLVDLGLIQTGEFIQATRDFKDWTYYEDIIDPNTLINLEIPLEGYIYPDTFFLDPETFEPQDLIFLAMDNFETKWKEIDKTGSILNKYSIQEVITMASIIENEVRGQEDRHIVSGILWKRLENSWPIGADATLLYITQDRQIDANDLALDSPYNTRKFQGLPPGPISNPSKSSLEAALFPQESPNWFYLTTLDTGEVIYATTNEEHNQNRAEHL